MLFSNGFYGQDIVIAFLPPEYCRLFAQKKAYEGGVTGTPGPRLAMPLLPAAGEIWWHGVRRDDCICRLAL